MKKHFLICFLLLCTFGYSQKKVLQTKFISDNITIDGKTDEPIWESAPIATDFVMFTPDNGKPIPENKRTEVKVLYDNDAIYVAALMYDDEPSKIMKEFAERDDLGSADFFGIFINGFNDGQQDFRFFVSASDGQFDCIGTDTNGEDYSWDAVWKSKAILTDFGWAVEMRIPYAALRFSSEKKQTWGVNFFREIRRDRQKYSWNFIDSKLGTFTQQTGVLEGIENIKTPTRLFLLPFASFYLNSDANQKTYGTLKGGLDLKYGINDAFTLDAMLVPDFGQTKYDDKVLNLGPFEQQYNENRSFFTEGTDLFSKGNIFYSRRIGGEPSFHPETTPEEKFVENPSSVNLINALKVSGRTKEGLGIGILNAVTEKTYATIENTTTGETKKMLVEPLANFNVLALDQRFHKNSSVSFINSNVTRDGSFRDGNVSALVWNLNTTKNTYNLSGDFKYSYVNDIEETKDGISTSLNFGETSGKFRYSLGGELLSKDYDCNDLGIIFETNYYSFFGNYNYRILNPTKMFNTFRVDFDLYSQFQKETSKVQKNIFSVNINSTTKKNHYFGLGLNYEPIETYNYYEPRTEGRYSINPTRVGGYFVVSSNYNNKFALDFNPSGAILGEHKRMSYGFRISPRYRFNDKFALVYDYNFFRQNNNKGFVDSIDDDVNSSTPNTIVYANRNVITYTNTLTGKYSLNSKMNLNLSARYYWSYTENKNFLSLQENGRYMDYPEYTENKNFNLRTWNLDLSYSWWFAPGSQVSVLYRSNALNSDNQIDKDFSSNFTNLIDSNGLNHVLSISVKYFIDYNEAKKIF